MGIEESRKCFYKTPGNDFRKVGNRVMGLFAGIFAIIGFFVITVTLNLEFSFCLSL